MTWIVAGACLVAVLAQGPRWLRIAQREHYLASSVSRFALRWWRSRPGNVALFVVAVATAAAAFALPELGLVAALITVLAPIGLGLRGRTSKLVWTRRLKTLAAIATVIDAAVILGLRVVAPAWCVLQPLVVDLSLWIAGPFERLAARRYVRSATEKLRAVHPTTVAITGSYGKTTTKGYLRHLASGSRSVLASPASFNNTGGLSRTLNEHLAPGTEVFVAEMGTYGPGEIASMVSWVKPDVAAIVNVGPVHLERMRSLDGIVAAKSEIFATARAAVLNVDAHGLATVADRLEAEGRRVIRVSTGDVGADVCVRPAADDPTALEVYVHGEHCHRITGSSAHPSNVAAAVGLVLALDIPVERVLGRLDTLPESDHRQQVARSAAGVTVIDNTFSSNPASAEASLALLGRFGGPHARRAVVTPGMVELGPVAREENRRFGQAAVAVASDLLIVGVTNRFALRAGASGSAATVRLVRTRDEAVDWVRANLRDGDVVLYENDLPDHYP